MITEPIDLEESDMSKLTSIQSRLNALQNIAFSAHDHEQRGVRVSRSSVSLREGYVFSITFFGHRVLGNLPQLVVQNTTFGNQITTDSPQVRVNTIVNGSVDGFKIQVGPETTACISSFSLASGHMSSIQNRLLALPNMPSGIIAGKAQLKNGFRFLIHIPDNEFGQLETFSVIQEGSNCGDIVSPGVHVLLFGQRNQV